MAELPEGWSSRRSIPDKNEDLPNAPRARCTAVLLRASSGSPCAARLPCRPGQRWATPRLVAQWHERSAAAWIRHGGPAADESATAAEARPGRWRSICSSRPLAPARPHGRAVPRRLAGLLGASLSPRAPSRAPSCGRRGHAAAGLWRRRPPGAGCAVADQSGARCSTCCPSGRCWRTCRRRLPAAAARLGHARRAQSSASRSPTTIHGRAAAGARRRARTDRPAAGAARLLHGRAAGAGAGAQRGSATSPAWRCWRRHGTFTPRGPALPLLAGHLRALAG